MNLKITEIDKEVLKEKGVCLKGTLQFLFDTAIGYNICRFCKNEHALKNVPYMKLALYEDTDSPESVCTEFRDIRISEIKSHIKSCEKFISNPKEPILPSRIRFLIIKIGWAIIIILFLVLLAWLGAA